MVILLIAVTVGLCSLVLKLLRLPMKLFFKLLIHAFSGFLLLFLVNLIGGFINISLPMTWFNAAVSGICGIPGVILLLIFRFIV